MTPTRRVMPPGESGFVLIEVLVSALVIAVTAGAVLTLLQSTTRSAADQRRHSTAQALAQEDQARLRTMRISSLNRLVQKTPVTIDGTTYTVESTGVFVNNKSGTASCTSGQTSADYVRITSSVSWTALGTRPAVTMQSIVSPSNGSLDASHGTLTIEATNAAGTPLSGVGLSGSGAGTFSGSTDSTGCATFADLAAGNYTLTPSAPGLVDKLGEAPKSQTVGVTASGTQVVQLRYDLPGSIPVKFKHRIGSTGTFKETTMDSILVYNAETGASAKAFPSSPSSRLSTITASSLFPFTTKYTVYAGTCEKDNPNPESKEGVPGAGAAANVLVPAGKAAETATIQVPSLEVTVKNGSANVQGARITITDDNCGNFKRVYTSESAGHQSSSSTGLAEYGLPWSTFDICASASISGTNRRLYSKNVPVQSLTSSAAVSLNLTGSGNEKDQICP
jgi:Tfp pilus assembly protein PilV